MHIHQLHDFAFGDHIGRFGQDFHHPHVLRVDHHLKSAGIQKITHQHAGGVAKTLVGSGSSAPKGGFIHHIVVQQRRCVYELHNSGQVVVLCSLVAQGARHQEQQGGANALAARRDDVLRHRAHQGHPRVEALGDHSVDGLHVGSDEGMGSVLGG